MIRIYSIRCTNKRCGKKLRPDAEDAFIDGTRWPLKYGGAYCVDCARVITKHESEKMKRLRLFRKQKLEYLFSKEPYKSMSRSEKADVRWSVMNGHAD